MLGGGNRPVAHAFASDRINQTDKLRMFKPAALAKAIAGVFVASFFTGISIAAETLEIGGLLFEYDQSLKSYVLMSNQGSNALRTWSFSTSSAKALGAYRDISFEGAKWYSMADGQGSHSLFKHDTSQTLTIKGGQVFSSLAINGGYVELLNKGTIAIEGSSSTSTIYSLANSASAKFENAGSFYVNGGAGNTGISTFFGDSTGQVNNLTGATMEFEAGFSGPDHCVNYFAIGGDTSLQNAGTITFRGGTGPWGYGGAGLGVFVANGVSAILNKNGGTINALGSSSVAGYGIGTFATGKGNLTIDNNGMFNFVGSKNGAFAISAASFDTATTRFTNHSDGVININKKGFQKTTNGAGTFTLINQGTINAEAETFFLKDEKAEIIETPVDIIIFTPSQGQTKAVNLDTFATSETIHHLNWKFDEKWANCLNWQSGGVLNITDIAAGTKEAELYKQAFEKQFGVGTGTRLNFLGTQSYPTDADSRITKPQFTIVHVNELISKGELQNGSIVTSEALHHKGKFTIGNMGEMTQDTGFMGIQGSTGITVKDGKTLTLMGSLATMAMAVGADTRDANYVITDAPLSLTNGNLNLGHANLSATEGKLAAVTYDNQSTVNINNGIFTFESLKGNGAVTVAETSRATVTGDFQTANATNSGTLTVNGKTTLSRNAVTGASTYAVNRNGFTNQKGTANFNGGLEIGKGTSFTNMAGAVVNAGAITMNELGTINAVKGSTINATSFDQNGIMRMLGTLNITGAMTVGDNSNTTLGGESTIGTLTVGRTTPTKLASGTGFFASPMGAQLRLTANHYVDELDFVSGTVSVDDGATLTGKTLKDGEIGSTITVANGGTFGFSHNKSSLDRALEGYVGDKVDKAILALNTDLHFANGGSLTVGTVADARGTVNLGSDSLLLLGTTDLHGEALLNGTSVQQLHVEDGATIAMTDDLMWGNHYILKGFDKPSSDEVMNVGVKDKDGKAMTLNRNDQGLFVTIGSDNILDKDKSFRLVNQMNWLLDGHQNTKAGQGDVAFLTNALLAKNGAEATNRMEALVSDAGVMAETQRMTAQVQTTMLDHATSARKGYGTFWVDGVFADVDSGAFERTAGASSYDVDTTGFVFGADLPVAHDYRLGVAFSAQRGDLDGQHGLSSDIEGYGLSVYGGYTFASGLNVAGSLSYLDTTHEVSAFNLGAVKANVDATAWVLGGRVSMPYAFNRMWVMPYVGFDVMKVNQDAFATSWSGKEAFNYAETEATILRTPVGVKAGTFVPLEMFGRSGTLNWDADLAFIPQFGDTEADYRVSGVSNGHSDGYEGAFANDWLSTLKLGMSWQGAAGAFGIHYGVEKGDVRNLSHSVKAKASLYF